MKKALVVVGLVASVLALGVLDWASPYITVREVKDLAERGNGAALAGYVDFASVRQNMKPQLKHELSSMIVSEDGKITSRTLGGLFGLAIADKAIDALVNERALTRLFQGSVDLDIGVGRSGPIQFDRANYRIIRDSFSDFSICPRDARRYVAVRFHRHFLSWKIQRIDLPPRLFGVEGQRPDICPA